MVNGINSGINPVHLFNATNAFKTASAKPEPVQEQPQVSEGVNLSDNESMLKTVDVKDVKKFASMIGEENLSDDDIKYGLTYGRSIMADWVV